MNMKTLISAVMLAGLAGTASADEKTVTLYSSNPEQAIEAVAGAVKDKASDIKLNSITGGSGVLLRRLEAEAANVQGDIFWSSSLRYPGNLFTPSNVHVVVLMVNENQLGDLPKPKTWTDLLDPKWKGKIVVADPANSSTGYTVLWGVHKMLGDDKLKQLAANVAVSSSSSAVQNGVAMGEYAVGLAFEANAYPYVDGGQEEIKLIYPEDGTFITADFAGLVKGAPGGDAAKKAFDILMSKETQTELLKTSFRRPSRGDIEVFDIDEKEAATQRNAFLDSWRSFAAAGAK